MNNSCLPYSIQQQNSEISTLLLENQRNLHEFNQKQEKLVSRFSMLENDICGQFSASNTIHDRQSSYNWNGPDSVPHGQRHLYTNDFRRANCVARRNFRRNSFAFTKFPEEFVRVYRTNIPDTSGFVDVRACDVQSQPRSGRRVNKSDVKGEVRRNTMKNSLKTSGALFSQARYLS